MKTGIPRPLARHPHEMASGLASLGRRGDSTLVHMSPQEVGGLQKLAMAHGGTLTTNPQTGLPEASFLSNILPLVGSALLGGFGGSTITDLLPELSVGVGLIDKAAGGSWTDALTKGLQFYGGASAGESLANMSNTPQLTQTQLDQIASQAPTAATTTSVTAPSTLNLETGAMGEGVQTPNLPIYNITPSGVVSGADIVNPDTGETVSSVTGSQSELQNVTSNPKLAGKEFLSGLGTSPLEQKLALAGIASGVGSVLQPSSTSSSGTPQNVPNAYYVPAAGYSSLWNQGTINPNFAKYGYLPPGQAMWLGQGMNPGTYTSTYPYGPGGAYYKAPTSAVTQPGTAGKATMNVPLGMKEGGLTSLKRFDGGGITSPVVPPPPMPPEQQATISQQALEQQAAMQHPAMPTNTLTQAYGADPTAAAMYMNALNIPMSQMPTLPSADAMNQYLANMYGPGNPVGGVTGQGGYTVTDPNANKPASNTGDSPAANTQGSITGGRTVSTPTDAGNTAGTAGSGTSYGGNVYGATDPTAGGGSNGYGTFNPSGSFGIKGSMSGVLPDSVISGAQSITDWANAHPWLATAAGLIPGVGLGILGAKGLNYLAGNAPQTQYASTPEEIASKNAEIQAGLDKQSQDMLDNYIQNNVPPEYGLNGQPVNPVLGTLSSISNQAGLPASALTPYQGQVDAWLAQNGTGTLTADQAQSLFTAAINNYNNQQQQGSTNFGDISPSDYISSGSNVSIMGNETTGDNPFGESSNGRNIYDPNTGQWIPTKPKRGMPTGMAGGGLAHGGIGSLPEATYAAGGKLLRGPGDGMSDSIPAVIHGSKPQRAALADGEFVIPADVVSHLGNGSTEAGSRKLYEMMDKIRHARTGRKQQAPAVKADKYLPA